MKILFVNTHYYRPQSFGGMSITLDQLCNGLRERGHEVVVLAGFRHDGLFARWASLKMRYNGFISGRKVARDTSNGYRVWRSWDVVGELAPIVAREQPDAIVVMGGAVVPVVREARRTEIPLLVQVHDVEERFHGGDYREVADVPCVANSHFCAAFYQARYGVRPAVIYPFVAQRHYRVERTGDRVTFINPYVHKGAHVAIAVARACPEIAFLFVGQAVADADGRAIDAATAALPNVERLPPQSDMRAVYRRTRILLAPSQWEEAFGRVAYEATISGIPVVGSTQGGLPEAIGEGGLTIAPDASVGTWASAIRRLWSDQAFYDSMSERAALSARRDAFNHDHQLDLHEGAILAAMRTCTL